MTKPTRFQAPAGAGAERVHAALVDMRKQAHARRGRAICPACNSANTTRQMIIIGDADRWRCESCNHEFSETLEGS